MVSYGESLREAREKKGFDLYKVSRDISIDVRYIEGLENEDNSVFPGEAYFIGFLRTYANYLELDTEYLIKLYHNKQLQEAPTPKELYTKKHSKGFIITLISLGVIITAALVAFVLIFINVNKKKVDENVVVDDTQKVTQYELTDRKFQKRVYKGDQFLIPTENDGKIVLTVRDTLSSFGIDCPSGTYYVELAEEAEIDVNGDNITDMIVYVSDISSTDDSRGAEINILLNQGIDSGLYQVSQEDIPLASDLKGKHPYKVILEDNRAYPFTVNASFRGPCLFRDKVDFNESVETYFSRGETFTATPKNGIRLWISNNNTVKFTIIADGRTFDLDIGSPGQVYVEDIKWIKDTDGKYKLVVMELD